MGIDVSVAASEVVFHDSEQNDKLDVQATLLQDEVSFILRKQGIVLTIQAVNVYEDKLI